MKLRDSVVYAQIAIGSFASSLNQTWDYIVVGGGASGIPLADRLSESGKSVLLIERGWPSSGRWGGTHRPAWLEGTNLTRFDVPALYQFIWTDLTNNSGILCPDVSHPASCVLGGGTAVNAGQLYKPTKNDWDLSMPPGFRSQDMIAATQRAFSRLPWTEYPSKDGKSYLTNGTQIAIDAITNASLAESERYRLVHANDVPDDKNHTVSQGEFFFLNGERGGPMATYLVTASQRKNFKLQMETMVKRVVRTGEHIEGVEVESTGPGGVSGVIKLAKSGRVILSAGVFGTSKVLFRSGIGPLSQLQQVQKSPDGPTLIGEKYWIDRPVGYNLDDAPALYIASSKEDIGSYDWMSAYDNPNPDDVKTYLDNRSGPLAMIQPSLGPVFWDSVKGDDEKTRIIQWNVNADKYPGFGGIILIAATLDHGHTSRGRLTIDTNLFINVSTTPYFNDPGDHDFKALLKSATGLLEIMKTIPNSSIYYPPANVTLEDYLRDAIRTTPMISSNHWVGSTRMSHTCSDGDGVVDATTRVCGTKNLHVVDAGIINGVPTANPQAVMIVAAERASEIILGLDKYV